MRLTNISRCAAFCFSFEPIRVSVVWNLATICVECFHYFFFVVFFIIVPSWFSLPDFAIFSSPLSLFGSGFCMLFGEFCGV